MMQIDTWVNSDCTIGRLTYGDFHCMTLELPYKDNAKDISCIPPGTYKAEKFESPKHGSVILLKDVPNRSFIEIHTGNFTYQLLGCILVGRSITYLDGDSILDVTESKNTLKKLLALLPDEFEIKIKRSYSFL